MGTRLVLGPLFRVKIGPHGPNANQDYYVQAVSIGEAFKITAEALPGDDIVQVQRAPEFLIVGREEC